MANTENIEAKLCAYVDGELDPAGRAEIEAHLVSNPQHRQLMDELMRQRELIAGLPRERAPEDLFEAMTNQLERSVLLDGDAGGMGAGSAGAGPAVAGRMNQWPQVFAAAAVLLLAVGLAAVIYFVLPAQNQPDYARVTPPPAGAPSVASPGVSGDLTVRTRTLSGSDAGTRPIELADRGAAADRLESKSGPAAKAGPSDVDTLAGAGAVAVTAPAPTALAAGPAPTLPPAAAAPATPEAPSLDPFSKSAFQAKPGASAPGLGVNVTNMFADAQINEKLKAAPGVPDNSMVVVVNAGNPSIANQQIQEYFANNGIKWEPVAEPMPAPLDLKQTQTVHGTRLADTRMRLKGGPPPAANDLDGMSGGFGGASATGSGGGAVGGAGGAGQQGERDAAKEQREQSQAVAQADESVQRRMKDENPAALAEQPQQDKQFADQSKLSRPAVLPPYPARKDAPDAPPAAVDAAQRRADGGDIGAAPSGTSTGAGAKAGKMPADLAPTEAESAQQSPTRDQVAPPESQHAQQQAAAAAPRMEQQGQQQQDLALQQAGQPHKQLQQQPQQPPAAMQQQLNMEPGQQGQQSQTHQVFIARGLTKQQVLAMNTAIANGNRIANYSRAGDTITPATLPSVDQTFRLDPPLAAAPPPADALAKKEGESAHAYSRATEPEPTTQPTGGALAMTTQPTTTATLDRAWDEESKRLATTAAVATTTPSTAPATTQAAAPLADAAGGAEDLVDVVILVQPEADPTAVEQIQQQQVAPNSAGVDVPSPAATPTPSTAPLEPGVTATSPASAPTPAPASAPR